MCGRGGGGGWNPCNPGPLGLPGRSRDTADIGLSYFTHEHIMSAFEIRLAVSQFCPGSNSNGAN